MSGQPILVVGAARSGTTWTARTLASAAGATLVNEPDNVDADPSSREAGGDRGFGAYPMLAPGDSAPAYEALWRAAFSGRLPRRRGAVLTLAKVGLRVPRPIRDPLAGLIAAGMERAPGTPPRAVVKSVLSHFSLDWLVDRFQPRVVVVQRDPLNVLSSWHELDVHGYDLHRRAAVLRRHLEPLGIDAPPPAEAGSLTLAAWWVGLLAEVMAANLRRHPEFLLVTHDDLVLDPVEKFRELYSRLGLEWGPATERFLVEGGYHVPTFRRSDWVDDGRSGVSVSRAQKERWKTRLSPEQVAEATAVLARFPNRGWVAD